MTEPLPTTPRIRRPWLVAAVVAGAVIAGLLIAIAAVVPLSSETARVRMIASLSDRLDGEVELRELRLRIFPKIQAEGRGLIVRHRGRRDVPPLISIDHFTAQGSFRGLWRKHIALVMLDGLDIEIPPDRNHSVDKAKDATDRSGSKSSAPSTDAQSTDARTDARSKDPARFMVIDELRSVKARLAIIPSEAGKGPKVWDIHDLRMTSVSVGQAMPFEATLTNAVPPGEIVTRGSFGPWQGPEPGETPLEGTFTFDRADLSVFKGISGILSSRGTFGGELARIDVHGETDTPLFEVKAGGHPVPLHTRYHAIVDGTNGNTILERIDASFYKTSIVAKGDVVGRPGIQGRTVTLNVTIDKGRLEDVLKLAVKAAKSPMEGALRLTTSFVLPPGDQDVVKKLRLKGRFVIADGRFASPEVQQKINELSRRTQRPDAKPVTAERVTSQFTGAFELGGGTLTIPEVTFEVPGAGVQLAGTYDLVPEILDFRGTLLTDAKLSEMVTGFKRVFLKIVDPLFGREGGGSAIPIKISGKRDNPSFGLDRGRVFRRNGDTKKDVAISPR